MADKNGFQNSTPQKQAAVKRQDTDVDDDEAYKNTIPQSDEYNERRLTEAQKKKKENNKCNIL